MSAILDSAGPAPVYESLFGLAPSKEYLAKGIDLILKTGDDIVRFLAYSAPRADGFIFWPTRAEAADMPQGLRALETLPDAMLFKYRSAAREFPFRADIAKQKGTARNPFSMQGALL